MKPRRYKPKITESDVKRQVKEYLSIKGYFHFHILQGLGAFLGIPDRIAIKGGRVLFLEIKKPGGKLSKHQIIFRDNILNYGGEYYKIENLNELIKVVDKTYINGYIIGEPF